MPHTFPSRQTLLKVYQTMLSIHGHRRWWPGESDFEVMVGAILTQNTAWKNVEKAIANLKQARLLSIHGIRNVPLRQLAQLIRPSGYFNQKAKKLKALIRYLDERFQGSLRKVKQVPLEILREDLLKIWGIGPETADSILLYALDKPIFVVDAYTKRILTRHHWVDERADYHLIQQLFMDSLPQNQKLFNDYHAQLVAVGSRYCKRSQALCEQCPLEPFLG